MTRMRHAVTCLIAGMLLKTSAGLRSIRTDQGVINVALDKDIDVAHVPDNEINLPVDGNRDSCINTETGHDVWWQVDLGDLYTVFDMRIKPTEDYFKRKFEEKEECYEKLRKYQGTVNTTISGLTCQRWDKQTPHRHIYTPENYWFRGENFLSNNYCRVPSQYDELPFCITTNVDVLREYCDVNVEECTNVLDKETVIKIGNHQDDMVNIDYKQLEEHELSDTFWTFLLPYKNDTRFVEFSQNGNEGYFNLCEVEIFGTKETIFNVAYQKTTKSSVKNLNSNKVVDGEIQSENCFLVNNGEHRWWRVDLEDVYVIYLLRIHSFTKPEVRPPYDYTLEFGFNLYEVFEKIFARTYDTRDSFIIDIIARYVQLSMPDEDYFYLCEVELYGTKAECPYNPCKNGGQCSLQPCSDLSKCTDFLCQCPTRFSGALCEDCSHNAALKKDVLASSIYYPSWLASNVNDGDINQYVGNGASCVATKKEIKPYLIVDLGAKYILSGVKVYKQLDHYPDEHNDIVQLLLMENSWTSHGYFHGNDSNISLKPYVVSRLVRLQITEETPVALRICEVEVLAVCQDDSTQVIHDSKPYMQMRFSLSNKYSDVVKEEGSFLYSIKEEFSIVTNYSKTSFQNMKVEKDPFRVSFELHSTDGNLEKLSKMFETIDILCEHGFDMVTEDGISLTIVAGSLQYHVMYSGTAGVMVCSRILAAIFMLFHMVTYL